RPRVSLLDGLASRPAFPRAWGDLEKGQLLGAPGRKKKGPPRAPGPRLLLLTPHEGLPMPRARKAKPAQSLYSVHPGVAMVQKWIADLPAKTGRTLEEWIALIRKE